MQGYSSMDRITETMLWDAGSTPAILASFQIYKFLAVKGLMPILNFICELTALPEDSVNGNIAVIAEN
jgi:hypothetical protein